MRKYDDPVCVLFDGGPRRFIWRGRLFLVREVQGRWSRATAWWAGAQARAARGEVAEAADGADLLGEREVWRVEAGNGHHRGVYELAHTAGAEDWVLRAVLD